MDFIYLALFALGMLAFVVGVTWTISWVFRLADRAHPLAWIPLAGLLLVPPFTIGL